MSTTIATGIGSVTGSGRNFRGEIVIDPTDEVPQFVTVILTGTFSQDVPPFTCSTASLMCDGVDSLISQPSNFTGTLGFGALHLQVSDTFSVAGSLDVSEINEMLEVSGTWNWTRS